MAATLKYQGRQQSKNKNTQSYKQTYVGTQQQIDVVINGLPAIGVFVTGKGYMTSYRKACDEGPYWSVEIEYTIENDASSFDNSGESVVGKKSATLSVRNLQLPLERLPNYLTYWNHYLISCSNDYIAPTWAIESKTVIIPESYRENFRWIKSISELPLERAENGNYWQIVVQPLKPGVECYDYAVFVVTESAKYRSASDAGSAIEKNINKIISPENDFGLSGGDWKCDESNISYDGKYWIASTTYTKSGDSVGWDKDIYQGGK